MGYSFAAGTTDGPGSFSFRQGMKTENPLWNAVRNLMATPTDWDLNCHGAKPILLATGEVSRLFYPRGIRRTIFREDNVSRDFKYRIIIKKVRHAGAA